jgi:hypothetical protein
MRLKNRVFFLVLALAVVVGLVVPARPARAYTSVSVTFFYDSLAPYGDWVTVSSYGRCWRPARVSASWQPYLDGEWIYTDAGWTWVSYDPWGGDPYHYGTWVYTARYGWIWIPGTIWAPAWVTWYITDDAFGWAPVPPSFGVGISGYAGPALTVSRAAYVFVPAQQFAGVNVSSVRVPVSQNATLISRSRPLTRFAVQGGVLSSGGPALPQVERVAGKRIERVSFAQAKTEPVPIKTSLRGGRGRAPVVVPATERAKLIAAHENRASQQPSGSKQVSRSKTEPVTSDRAVRSLPPPAAKNEKRDKTSAHQPPPPAREKREKATVHQPSAQPSNEGREKAVRSQPASPPSPPSKGRPERTGSQAQAGSGHDERSVRKGPQSLKAEEQPRAGPPQGHVEKQSQGAPPVERQAAKAPPKAQNGPPPGHANPQGKEKEKEHGKDR